MVIGRWSLVVGKNSAFSAEDGDSILANDEWPTTNDAVLYNPSMNLTDQIQKDITTAMKARDEARLSTLRMVKSALKNREIEKMAPLDDKEAAEIDLIESYLPKAAGEEEITEGVKAVIAEMGSPTMKDMGTVMKNAMAKFSAQGMRVDGKQVSEAVKKELAGK